MSVFREVFRGYFFFAIAERKFAENKFEISSKLVTEVNAMSYLVSKFTADLKLIFEIHKDAILGV